MADAYTLPAEKCGCGAYPRFDTLNEPDGVMSFFACPPPPRGCGRAGPMVASAGTDRSAAAAAWDRMRREAHAA